jgi:hypothetical protein
VSLNNLDRHGRSTLILDCRILTNSFVGSVVE